MLQKVRIFIHYCRNRIVLHRHKMQDAKTGRSSGTEFDSCCRLKGHKKQDVPKGLSYVILAAAFVCLLSSCGYADSSLAGKGFGTPLTDSDVNADSENYDDTKKYGSYADSEDYDDAKKYDSYADSEDDDAEDLDLVSDEQSDKIYVYVCGAVKNPGVYALDYGERQMAAVEAAGGMLPDACADGMNLAMVLSDGERVYVPVKDEVDREKLNQQSTEQAQSQTSETGLVNINTAAKEQLMTLPGIGASKAQRIIEYRETYGRFPDIESLKNVPGIKSGTYDSLKNLITAG